MVSSVSSVGSPYGNNQVHAMDKVSQEQLYSPGMYTSQELMEPPVYREKKGGFISFLGKLVLTAAIVGGGAVAARKLIPALTKEHFDITGGLPKESSIQGKAKYYLAKVADWIEEHTVGLIKKMKEGKAEEGAEPPKAPANGEATK